MAGDESGTIRTRIATEVRAEMGRQGMSIRKLALLLGKDPTTTGKLTRGVQPFKAEDLTLTARILGVPVSQFLPIEPEREAVA